MGDVIYRLRYVLSILQPSALAVRPFRCPLCGPGFVVRLSRDSIGVRCVRCGASAIAMALVATLKSVRPGFAGERLYELSSRGPVFEFLRREVANLTFSEYFDDVPPGQWRNGVQCQDVQRLTFPNECFDVCTSTEVFEHVPDDTKGFAEIRRVLRPGGVFIFSVPIEKADRTIDRAVSRNGTIEYLLPPTYHDDRIRGRGQVLVFRDYGGDITERLRAAGFYSAHLDTRLRKSFLGFGASVVVAAV